MTKKQKLSKLCVILALPCTAFANTNADLVGTNAEYSYKVLDHAENTNTKQLYQLTSLKDGILKNKLTLGGQVTALLNYQKANEDSKFGWLMRHPTANNQIGETASEAVIHSANLNMTAKLNEDFTAYVEMLYNPEQNFAANSSITGLPRNNVNVRRAYVLWGNLANSPWYGSLGKMDIPFGLNDTVSPFTNSTNWHSFAGLAYGAQLGYANNGTHLRFMAIQGGAQFRNANMPVDDTNVPSRLNNFALDANYTIALSNSANVLVGASYQHGSSYCQNYEPDQTGGAPAVPGATITAPSGVQHFNACDDKNPQAGVYATFTTPSLKLLAEFAQTLDEWPGTFNPSIPEFEAAKNKTFTVGGRFSAKNDIDYSFEFSRFKAGPSGSPWEKQDQFVLGASRFVSSNINLFAELIHVKGWVPLNFLSGGNPGGTIGESWASQDSTTDIITFGIQAAF